MAKVDNMADRMQFLGVAKADPELVKALEASRETVVTEQELREQRISSALYKNPRAESFAAIRLALKLH